TLKVQFKYFGLTDFFLKNLGNYSAMFAYEVKKNIDVCFKEILKLLNSEISVDLSNNQLKKAIAESYLKFSIYQIYRNKVEGIKYYLQAIYTKPLIFLSKNSFLFLLRLITMREKIYYSLKFLFVRALEKL
ncbi:MAG: hypothetical protein NZ891_01385, partial [bacterium]|nr:hypothetical protein [bacterium]MDW8163380.1 hypothetical protein [Candidatus Omnitrophota bacterium]